MARDDDGFTPLHFAVRSDYVTVVEILLAAGADPTAPTEYGWTPVHEAATKSNPAVLEALLAADANPAGRHADGNTPLHAAAACESGVVHCGPAIEALLDAGADPTARNAEGATPLDLAEANAALKWSEDGYWRLNNARALSSPASGCDAWNTWAYFQSATVKEVRACLATGAAVAARTDEGGITALHWAAWNSEDPAVLAALLAAGADLEARNANGRTPLQMAAANNANPAVLGVLLDAGADLETRDDRGRTPLHGAIQDNENLAVIEALLAAGADVRAEAHHTSPIQVAARHGRSAVFEALLAAGADLPPPRPLPIPPPPRLREPTRGQEEVAERSRAPVVASVRVPHLPRPRPATGADDGRPRP